MVPFLRAVRAEERGREATFPLGSLGREATPKSLGARLRSSVSALKVALNINRFQ